MPKIQTKTIRTIFIVVALIAIVIGAQLTYSAGYDTGREHQYWEDARVIDSLLKITE